MNLLYFSKWVINDGLTNSTITQYLEHLSSKDKIDKNNILYSRERFFTT